LKKKVKLEFFDRVGTKHSISIEGEITVDKLRRLLEYAEIMTAANITPPLPESSDTKISRLLDVINTTRADRSFDSREIWRVYRETWGDDLSLGAVSTYLSRLADRGALEREGSSAHWVYRVKTSPSVSQ